MNKVYFNLKKHQLKYMACMAETEPGRNKVHFSLCSQCPWFCSVGPPLEKSLQPTTQVKRIKLATVMLEAHAANAILSEYTSVLGVGVEEVFLGIRKTVNRQIFEAAQTLRSVSPHSVLYCPQSLLTSFTAGDQVSTDSSKA